MKILWTILGLLAACVVAALLFDAYVGYSQPELDPGLAEGVLYTWDEEGQRHETRLAVVEEGGTLWVQSGHHFRGWYERLRHDPDVELARGGETRAYRAVPLDTPEARSHVVRLLKERVGSLRFRLIRAVLLYAEIKPVRLDPR